MNLRFLPPALLVFVFAIPAAATRDRHKILWDVSKGPLCDASGCYRPSGAYSIAAGWLAADGWTVVETSRGVLQEPLGDYGILVVSQLSVWSGPPYTFTEVAAIRNFVTNGGSLLVLLESQNFPWRCDQAEPVSRPYGITCAAGGMDYGGSVALLADHPVNQGSYFEWIELGSALIVQPPATVISRYQPSAALPIVAVADPDRDGRVVVIGDSHLFGNREVSIDYPSVPARPFLESALCWLVESCAPPPVITAPLYFACRTLGDTLTFTASASRSDGGTLTLDARMLPTGATFPTVTGTGTVSSTFTWTVGPESSGPIVLRAVAPGSPLRSYEHLVGYSVTSPALISTQPAPVSICSGGSATFTVAGGDQEAWQWQQSTDGGATFVDVPAGTGPAWTSPPQTASSLVRCEVHGGCGIVLSDVAALTVSNAPPGSPANGLRFTRTGAAAGTLSWSAALQASDYVVSRCTPSGGSCVPAPVVTTSATSAAVTFSAPLEWWTVSARNGCGVTP